MSCWKSKKRIIITLFVALLCVMFGGCGKSNAQSLADYGVEQFMEKDYKEYIQGLRDACGLMDLDITTNVHYYYEFDYDKDTKTLNAECTLDFTSDDIDNYYATEDDKETANKLANVLRQLKNAYYKEPTYTYTSKKGTINLKICNGVSDEICVTTSSGREYEFSYYVNYDTVQIDGVWVYNEKMRNDDYSSGTNSSYTGSYDATLSYGTGSVLICVSEDAMSRYMTALNNNNQGTIDEMYSNGQIGYTAKGTKCNIVERKVGKIKVTLLDGSYAGNTVWVISESVQEK